MNQQQTYPLVSLIIGCYNGEKFINRAFAAVIEQTYPNIELIFVNDGSTDNSEEIATGFTDVFKQKNISFIILNQSNQGYYSTSGIKACKGKYITTLDIDDYLMPDSIEKRINFLESYPFYSAVRTNGYEVMEDNLNDTSNLFVTSIQEKQKEDIFEDLLLGKTNNWAGSYMVKSSVLFSIFPDKIVPGSRFGQNLQILMPVVYNNKCGFIDEPLMKYIRTNQSFTLKEKTYEREIELLQNYKKIRLSIIELLQADDSGFREKLDQVYLYLYMEAAKKYAEKTAYNTYYSQIQQPSIVDKIGYCEMNKLTTQKFIYRIIHRIKLELIKR